MNKQKEVLDREQIIFYNVELSKDSLIILENKFSLNTLLSRINCDFDFDYRTQIFNRHNQLKIDCNQNKLFNIFTCSKDFHKKWFKLNCNSFFCNPCHEDHLKTTANHLQSYLMNVNHRSLVFTIPEELRSILKWDQDHIIKLRHKHFKRCPICNSVFMKEEDFRMHINFEYINNNFKPLINIVELPYENDFLDQQQIQEAKLNLLNANYKVKVEVTTPINKYRNVVKKTLDEYYENYTEWGQKVLVGEIALLHTYGSLDLKWKPHDNIFVSTLGFVEYKNKYKKDYLNLIKKSLKKKRSRESPIKALWKRTRTYTYKIKNKEITKKYFMISTSYIDIKKIKKLYAKNLNKGFGINIENPIIWLDTEFPKEEELHSLIKKNKYKYGIPANKLISRLADYYKRLPIKTKDISQSFFTDSEHIKFTTYKRKQFVKGKKLSKEELYIKLDLKEFNERILQHLPPNHFKNLRLWNLYHVNKEKRKALYYPIKEQTILSTKPLCPKCKTPMDLACSVICGVVIYFNPLVNNKLDIMDLPLNEILLQEIPEALKPPNKKLEYLSTFLKRQETEILNKKQEKILDLNNEIDFNKGISDFTSKDLSEIKGEQNKC